MTGNYGNLVALLLFSLYTNGFRTQPHSSLVECGVTRYYNPGQLLQADSQDLSCCGHFHFVSLRDHNPPVLHMDELTDGCHVFSVSVTSFTI